MCKLQELLKNWTHQNTVCSCFKNALLFLLLAIEVSHLDFLSCWEAQDLKFVPSIDLDFPIRNLLLAYFLLFILCPRSIYSQNKASIHCFGFVSICFCVWLNATSKETFQVHKVHAYWNLVNISYVNYFFLNVFLNYFLQFLLHALSTMQCFSSQPWDVLWNWNRPNIHRCRSC